MARMVRLLNCHQCSSLACLSTSDGSTTLIYNIKTLQMAKRKVSTLFLNIKGGLDNINPQLLYGMLTSRSVNPYLVS